MSNSNKIIRIFHDTGDYLIFVDEDGAVSDIYHFAVGKSVGQEVSYTDLPQQIKETIETSANPR